MFPESSTLLVLLADLSMPWQIFTIAVYVVAALAIGGFIRELTLTVTQRSSSRKPEW
jgi:hypothetical protein